MTDYNQDFWNERYNTKEFIFGQQPNAFFKSELIKLNKGKLYLPGDGEGRNSVYAASVGWQVDAVDQSKVAVKKAKKLAKSFNVNIHYQPADLGQYIPKKNFYDAAAIIFVHLPPQIRKFFHKKVIDCLKRDGTLIIEVFGKKQLGKNSGGPQNPDMLYSITEIKKEFNTLNTIFISDEIVYLDEGDKHSGEANVIRYVGRKT